MKKGDIIRVIIDGITTDGSGTATVEGRKLVVNRTFPGDEADILITGLKRHTASGKLENIVSSSIERVSPKCRHYEICGGCRWQELPYPVQCGLKAGFVKNALKGVPGIEEIGEIEIIPSPDIYFYRNKMEFSFDKAPWMNEPVLGLHESGKFDRVFNVEECLLQSELSNRLVIAARNFTLENGLSAYGMKSHIGLMRFLMVRDGKLTGELMANIVTSGEDFPLRNDFLRFMIDEVPELTTVVHSINRSESSVSAGEERETLYGAGRISEKVGDYEFVISPDAFFQTNPCQTKNLYDTIKEFASTDGTQRVLDLYCGTGSIGIYLSREIGSVTGIEMVEDAIKDANENAALNGITNIDFICGLAEKTLTEDMTGYDLIVCDPPRAGIHPKAMNKLVMMRIPRFIYISCNVKAIPGDLERLCMAGYRVKKVRAFDMSPHTPHVETVMLLEITG